MELLKVITTGSMEINVSDYTYGKCKQTLSKKYSEAVKISRVKPTANLIIVVSKRGGGQRRRPSHGGHLSY